jgi:type II secretory pathway pseudopilin PulG
MTDRTATVADACRIVADRTGDQQAAHVLRDAANELDRLTEGLSNAQRYIDDLRAENSALCASLSNADTARVQRVREALDGFDKLKYLSDGTSHEICRAIDAIRAALDVEASNGE